MASQARPRSPAQNAAYMQRGYTLLQPMNFHVTTAAACHSTSGITSWPARVLITIGTKEQFSL